MIVNPKPAGLSVLRMNDAEKQARRAEALRANLRKRKQQARAQAEPQRDFTQPAADDPKA
ncbi:hypothetical protein E5A73_11350 [Sphingomonas gei]|uniref:Uncharacterized protein n=1 Tax=Sphingomonas gei TaxID=1395960 RepID=A0A4S1XDA2_9SPHN|nr:hypothetical protein E5A73_11350 [Sphingomonas gei]